jgi:hypothetical protein
MSMSNNSLYTQQSHSTCACSGAALLLWRIKLAFLAPERVAAALVIAAAPLCLVPVLHLLLLVAPAPSCLVPADCCCCRADACCTTLPSTLSVCCCFCCYSGG